MTRWLSTGVALLLLIVIAACSNTPDSISTLDSQAPGTTDATSADTAVADTQPEPAERIVALTSLTADLVQTLSAETLIGIPGSPLIQQDERFEGLTVVSEGRLEPDLEQIIALEPDLVIGATGFHDKTLQRLETLNVRTLQTEVNSWDELRSLTEILAATVTTDPQPLLDRYDACLEKAPEEAPGTLILVSRQPLLTPNKNSWAGDFLAQFNVENLAADLQGQSPFDGYVTLSEEKVLEANPDALLVVDTGENLIDQLQAESFWRELQATQDERVYAFDYFGLVNPGSIASIEQTCSQLSAQLQ